MRTEKVCTVEGCGRKYFSTGLCIAHYRRKERGVPLDKVVQVRLAGQITYAARVPKEYHDVLVALAAQQKTTVVDLNRQIVMAYLDGLSAAGKLPAPAEKPRKKKTS